MTTQATSSQNGTVCATCKKTPENFFQRYKEFLYSPGTLITYANSFLLVLGFVATLLGQKPAANWLFLASALIGGAPIFKLAFVNIIKKFDLTAGVMVSIAMIAALLIGEYSAAALVAFMMLVGEMLENFTMARANNALKELSSLIPNVVTIRREGEDVDIPVEMVRLGDLALVRPGSRLPVDGIVVNGFAAIDQSSITGESIPVEKEPGDHVYAGTLCTSGSLEVQTEKIGDHTVLGNMMELVRQAQTSQAPVQRVANKYAQYLTPLALVIAIVTYFLTRDLVRSITVLIVICPCSLVLATPTAVVAAIGNAARRGVLVKNGTAMEQIGKMDVIAFDKTGTLTLGEPCLKEIISLNHMNKDEILYFIASAERSSEHPLGKAVVTAANAANIKTNAPEHFEMTPGHGIRASVKGREILIGNRVLSKYDVKISDQVHAQTIDLERSGNTVIPVAIENEIAGLLVIADAVRPESKETIRRLKQLGIKETILISGDNQAVAKAVGRELGVDQVYAQTLPEQKLDLVRAIQNKGLKIAYIGDGVNDAPAMAASDIGIAMGTVGTAVAMEMADIVLLSDKIERLPDLIDLSRTSLVVIRNNVFFSMGWNLLSVILSVFGVIGPVFGAIMHEISSVPVIANSASLINRKPKSSY